MLKTGIVFTQVDLWLGLSYCDGNWNKVTVNKEGSVVSASVNELREQTLEPNVQQLKVNSPVYIGGIPSEIQNIFKDLGSELGKVTTQSLSRFFRNFWHVQGCWTFCCPELKFLNL